MSTWLGFLVAGWRLNWPTVFLLGLPIPSLAVEPKPMNQAEFLAAIEARGPWTAVRAAAVGQAQAEVVAASVRPNPAVQLDREQVFGATGQTEHQLAVTWPLDLSGRLARQAEAARLGVDVAKKQADLQVWLRRVEALQTFRQGQHARARLQALEDMRNQLTTLVEAVRARARRGDASAWEADRVELEIAAWDDALAGERAALQRLVARLGWLAGEETGVLPQGFVTLPAERTPTAMPQPPGREVLDLRARQAEAERRAADRATWPTVAVVGGLKTQDQPGGFAAGYVAGIAVGLPVFDRGAAEQARAAAARHQALAERGVLDWQVHGQRAVAWADLQARVRRARDYESSAVARVAQLLRRASVAYREGEAGLFEVLDAWRTSRDVRLRSLDLVQEAREAELDLWRALGAEP